MNFFEEAVREDINGDYIQASALYEKSIERADNPDAYINLAVLYFQFTDFGINASQKLPVEFIRKALGRFDEVINLGMAKFPQNGEMKFWSKYFRFSSMGDKLEDRDIIDILRDSEPSLVPYFFLYLSDPVKYSSERDALSEQCHRLLTSKNRWILSLIE